jgi:hypothetical protein
LWIGHETDRRNAAPPVALGNGGPGGKGRKKDTGYPKLKSREEEIRANHESRKE